MYFKISSSRWFKMMLRASMIGCVAAVLLLLTVGGTSPIEQEKEESSQCSCKTRFPATETLDAAFRHALGSTQKGDGFRSCWSCPLGYKRTLAPIKGDDACVISTRAKKVGSYGCKNKCGKDTFFDPRKGGECWKCPKGFRRTWDPVTAPRACSKGIFGPFSRATFMGHSNCDRGFKDMVDGGTCWTCSGGKRTIFHVKGEKACEVFSPATFRGSRHSFPEECGVSND